MLEIIKITTKFADIIYDIQQKSFMPLLQKYHDYDNENMSIVSYVKHITN